MNTCSDTKGYVVSIKVRTHSYGKLVKLKTCQLFVFLLIVIDRIGIIM